MIEKRLLPMNTTIPPGMRAVITARVESIGFRPERLLISPHSFPLPIARRVWTWPLVAIGRGCDRAHRALARLLLVDLRPRASRREVASEEFARDHPDEVSWEEYWDDDDDDEPRILPYVDVQDPPSRRERLLEPIRGLARHLTGIRLRWQHAQLATLVICDIRIASRSQFVDGAAPLPAEMFAVSAIDQFLHLQTSEIGQEIQVEIMNTGRRECELVMSFIGTEIRASASASASGESEGRHA